MKTTAYTLPNDAVLLKKIVLEQQDQLASQQQTISTLMDALRLEKVRRFGASSEKCPSQNELFDEAEAHCNDVSDETGTSEAADASAEVIAKPASAKPRRKPLPKDLPRIRQVYELPEDERHCPCGCTLSEIGEDISEQLDIIPAKLRVIQHVRKKYACKHCEETLLTAAKPAKLLPKSNASAGLLAYVATAKYQDALPLYRLSSIFKRLGIDLSRHKPCLTGWLTPDFALSPYWILCEHNSIWGRLFTAMKPHCKCLMRKIKQHRVNPVCGCKKVALQGDPLCYLITTEAVPVTYLLACLKIIVGR